MSEEVKKENNHRRHHYRKYDHNKKEMTSKTESEKELIEKRKKNNYKPKNHKGYKHNTRKNEIKKKLDLDKIISEVKKQNDVSSKPKKEVLTDENLDLIISRIMDGNTINKPVEEKFETKKEKIIYDETETLDLSDGKEGKTVDISFVGQASDEVTGSMILVKSKHRQILLECGLYQDGNNAEEEYEINSAKFPFVPRDLDYVFVCHCHTDHIGLVPRLYKEKSFAQLIMPENSEDVAEILMKDCAKIMSHDSKDLERENHKQYPPIYTQSDVEYTLSRLITYPIGKRIALDEYVSFRFVPSGHIMNACQLELFITEDGVTKKIVYTSDLGNTHIKKDYVTEFSPIGKADILIGESTYGNTNEIATQKTRDEDLALLKKTIDDVIAKKRGIVLIPVFANDRCQAIMTALYNLYHEDKNFKLNIYVDSPMAASICDVYYNNLDGEDFHTFEKVCDWKYMHIVYDRIESKNLFNSPKSKIILASSGMLDQGKANAWFGKICASANNACVFCGYSVEGTLASKVKTMDTEIEHMGKKYKRKCNVTILKSFSSHMQRDSLTDYYTSIHAGKIVLVHGDEEDKKHFAKVLNKYFNKNKKEREAICAHKGLKISL